MGRILTNRYNQFYEKIRLNASFSFIKDVYRSGKLRELTSFMIWEFLHRLKLFPKGRYLKFANSDMITLENLKLDSQDFNKKITQLFKNCGLHILRSDHNWKLLYFNNEVIYGCLYPEDRDLYKSIDNGKSIQLIYSFPQQIKAIFASSNNAIFVSVKGAVYRSADRGASFTKVLDFGSSVSFFRYNNGMTETPNKTLIIAEYGNVWENNGWRKLAYLYYSFDDGEKWEKSDFLIKKGTNKHVHLVKYSQALNKILMADGDNKKKLWVSDQLNSSDSKTPKWNLVNTFHIQMGGYTSIVENDGKLVFGTDYQGGTNFIVETTDCKHFSKKIIPDPYRRSPIDNMVLRNSKGGNEVWANLPFSTSGSKCLLMYSANNGESWQKVIEYSKTTHIVWLINSSNKNTSELYFSIEDLRNNDRIVYKIADEEQL